MTLTVSIGDVTEESANKKRVVYHSMLCKINIDLLINVPDYMYNFFRITIFEKNTEDT